MSITWGQRAEAPDLKLLGRLTFCRKGPLWIGPRESPKDGIVDVGEKVAESPGDLGGFDFQEEIRSGRQVQFPK